MKVNDYKCDVFCNQPEETQDMINIDDIVVPDDFKKTKPRGWKMVRCATRYGDLGHLDEPITVIVETNENGLHNKFILVDGYTRYLYARYKLKMSKIPVKYIDIDTYCISKNI